MWGVAVTDVSDEILFLFYSLDCTHRNTVGACRQVMSEFGNFDVYCLRPNGKVSRTTLADLIPFAFSPSDLSKGQGKGEEDEPVLNMEGE